MGATTIEPGQSTELVVKFTMSETMGGPHRFDVTVKSNDPVEPTQVVTVKARFP